MSNAQSQAEGPATQNDAQSAAPPPIYQNGLIATVHIEPMKVGEWAHAEPAGVPVGSYVDAKVPTFAFSNLKQDDAAWSLWSGNRVGILWDGFIKIEETGPHAFVSAFHKIPKTLFYANSCAWTMTISGRKILDNSYKFKEADGYLETDAWSQDRATSIDLQEGYYPIKIWLNCGVSSSSFNRGYWKTDDFDDASWTLKVKRPSDRIVQPAPTGMLVWK